MAAAAAGIFSQHIAAAQALAGKAGTLASSPAAATSGSSGTSSSSGSSSSSSGDSATISANDFLTLLVTEMQNQDPTADTDPNEYINQLVQVNSLEQLIDINQTLTADSTTGTSTTSSTGATPAAAKAAQAIGHVSPAVTSATAANNASAAQSAASPASATPQVAAVQYAPGNLGVQKAKPAAAGVAHALDGRWHAHR